jgi:DnaK suppressor protein
MNATVTRSAAKSAAAKSVNKLAAKTGVIPKTKTAGKPVGKLSKTMTSALKPPSKTAAAGKAAVKPARSAVKGAAVKPASKAAPKTAARATAAKKVTPAAKSGTVKTSSAKTAPPRTAAGKTDFKTAQSGSYMSSNNASAGLTDKIEQTVVSKVREVATKTTKPTPTVADDGTPLLTEAQILKMSDKDYMNEAQLAFFKARLQQLERDLLKNAGETTEHLRETVLVPDPADRATIEEEHALELRTRDRERKLLKKVQQAIASIDAGDYGWCEETGEPIGIPRLLARPTATLSLEAQQRRELKQKLYGD